MSFFTRRRVRPYSLCAALAFAAFSVVCARAQSGTSAIRGQVLDPQSRGIPAARVTISDENHKLTRNQVTDGSGGFFFASLPPGTYALHAEAPGFKKLAIERVTSAVNVTTEVPVRLELGEVTQTVTVASGQEALQTADATLGNPFEGRRIEQLPLNARNIVGLLSLQPGVTRFGEVNGSRRDQANVTLDGADNNYQLSGLDPIASALGLGPQAFASVLRATPESVAEFRVVTSTPNATEGRSSGAQVSLVTRSGTNQFHGSAYVFNRNTAFTANDWFNNQAGRYAATDSQVLQGIAQAGDKRVPRPKLNRNVFGFTAGGPLIRNRLFFFFNYEGRRDASQSSVVRYTPTAAFRQGILQYQNTSGGVTTVTPEQLAALFPGTGGVNPVVLQYLQAVPLPNTNSIGDGLNQQGYRFNAKTPAGYSTGILRLDYRITDRQFFFVRGNYQNDNYQLPQQFPNSPVPRLWVHPKGVALGHNWSLGSRKVNTARFALTRESLAQHGDSDTNIVRFYTFRPTTEQRSNTLISPTVNLADDFSMIAGQHSLSFGGNVRAIRNDTSSLRNAFDLLSANYNFYPSPATTLAGPLTGLAPSFLIDGQASVAILLGRLTQYTANVLYGANGQPLPTGTAAVRSFATQEYEGYAQDSWRIRPNLTLVYGIRYSVDRPVYERHGFQAAPTVNLGTYLAERQAGAARGQPYNAPISIQLSGPANNGAPAWNTNWNNIAPHVAIAWSPNVTGILGKVFGASGQSVIRGGFRELFDRFGSSLMAYYDQTSTLGFFTTSQTSAGVFNLTNNLPPLLTTQVSTRSFPGVVQPTTLTFPRTYPSDQTSRFDTALDSSLQTPREYTWNFTYGRTIAKTLTVEASYVGRLGRHLLISRDIMQNNNLTDPASGQTWYQAAGLLAQMRNQGLQFGPNGFNRDIPNIPWFNNLYPGTSIRQAAERLLGRSLPALNGLSPSQQAAAVVAAGSNGLNMTNWTGLQSMLNNFSILGQAAFTQPQYASLLTYSTVGSSNYNALVISVRERLSSGLTFDFNYTWSKSFDTGSTLEGGDGGPNFGGLALNSFNVAGSRALSNFDIPHSFNSNFLWAVPVGRNRHFGAQMSALADALVGGWQLTGIWRYHTGLPINFTEATGYNATASQQPSNGVRTRPVETSTADVNGYPSMFANPVTAYQSFVNAMPGQQGDRNVFRLPHYSTMDAGLAKSFHLPRLESHVLQIRWEVFNLTNSQPFGPLVDRAIRQDPFASRPQATWGRFGGSQTPVGESRPGRVMQFGMRYSF